MEYTGTLAIGNGEPCPFCKLIFGKDFEDATSHLHDKHPKEFMAALFGEDKS